MLKFEPDKRDTIPMKFPDMKIIEEQFEDCYSQINFLFEDKNESNLPSHLSIENSIMNFDLDQKKDGGDSIEINPF